MLVVEECGMDFSAQYGPWAIIAGASEGTGRAYARFLAAKGLSLILIARRRGRWTHWPQRLRANTAWNA